MLTSDCQDPAFQSIESGIDARVKASKQLKSAKDKHAFTISAITHDYNLPYHQVGIVGTGSIAVDWGDSTSTTHTLDPKWGVNLEKNYELPGRYQISITLGL